MYQTHCVKIRAEDRKIADEILEAHEYDIDDISTIEQRGSDGSSMVEYWIKPFVYEDLEKIIDEFKQAGIHVL